MATIYRFIVEGASGGGVTSKSGTGSNATKKKKKGEKGGVDLNRYRRIGTTIGNKLTGGNYSKGVRFARAFTHITYKNEITGKTGVSGVALFTVIYMAINAILNGFKSYNSWSQQEAERFNTSNYRKLETGQNQISKNAKITTNFFSGKINYSENK